MLERCTARAKAIRSVSLLRRKVQWTFRASSAERQLAVRTALRSCLPLREFWEISFLASSRPSSLWLLKALLSALFLKECCFLSPLLLLNTIFPASQHTKCQHKTHRLVKLVTKVRGLLSATKVAQLSCGGCVDRSAWCGVCGSTDVSVRQSTEINVCRALVQSYISSVCRAIMYTFW